VACSPPWYASRGRHKRWRGRVVSTAVSLSLFIRARRKRVFRKNDEFVVEGLEVVGGAEGSVVKIVDKD